MVCQGCVSTVVLKTAEIHIEEEIDSTFGRFGLKTLGHSLETTDTKSRPERLLREVLRKMKTGLW